jgi:small-conductance mechanosensitive channel
MDLFKSFIMQSALKNYLLFVIVFVLLIIVVKLIKKVVFKRLKLLVSKTATEIDDLLVSAAERYLLPLGYFFAFYFAALFLAWPEAIKKVFDSLKVIVILVFGIQFLVSLITPMLNVILKKNPEKKINRQTITVMGTILKIIVWSIALIILLDNLGIKISALITGLGIGGIAIALAAQTVLGDLFSYFIIFFDRPFEIGDFIIVGDFMGTVENIGIKTTRVRSLGGEEVIFPNTDLTGSRVKNYKRMQLRRIVFKLGVTYETSLEKIKQIPILIEEIIKKIPDTRFDRAHFFEYGDFSLVYEVVYFVLSSDYNIYMDIQQKINFAIKEAFDRENIDFAYPTQTLFLKNQNNL